MSSNRSSAFFVFLALFALSSLAAQGVDTPVTAAGPVTADTPAAAEPDTAPAAKPKAPTTVTIKNARSMEFTKDPISGGDAIMLTGAAEISVESDGKTTTIFAEKIYVNRDKDMLYAEGSVILNRKGGANEENLTANSLLINTETFEGIFDGARIVSLGGTPAPSSSSASSSKKDDDAALAAAATTAAALGGASKSTLIVNSELFGRDTKGTMVFKNGSLTFCDDEENPHWKITASRIYLLPGQEFALANMVLWVGSVPVLWLPGFYYPKDELIFNPAFGTEDRRGFFVQTTTYIIGRKPLPEDGSESSFNFLKNTSLKKQVREGLILHNLDEDAASTGKNYLKIMGDYYSNLGFMAGVEGILIPPKYVTELDFSFLLGFSRTIFGSNAPYYSVYNPSDGKEHWDKTNLFGQEIPFRYKGNVNVSMNSPFSLSVKMPFYSDTEFDTDFKKREESMDWLSYITTNKLADEEDDTVAAPVPSYNWKVNASYNVPVSLFNPFVNSLSLNYSFDLLFANARNDTIPSGSPLQTYDPLRTFFYPSQMVPVDAKVSLAGTLITVPLTKRVKSAKKSAVDAKPAGIIPPEDITPPKKDDAPNAVADDITEKGLLPQTALPSMTAGMASAALPGGLAYSLGYTFTPEVKVTNTYPVPQRLKPGGNPTISGDWWNDPAESSLDALKSLGYTIKPTTALNSGISWRDGFIGMTNKIGISPVIENHTLTEQETGKPPSYGFTSTEIETIRKTDFNNTKLDITAANVVSFKPFIYNEMFSGTGVAWNTDFKILRNKFRGTTVDDLERDFVWTGWDDESFTLHTVSAIFAFAQAHLTSSLTLTANLPPRLDAYSTAFATAFAPWVTVGASAGIHKLETDPTKSGYVLPGSANYPDKTGDGWVFDPFRETLTVKLFKEKLNLTQSYAYDIEEKENTELRFGLSGYGTSFTFAMQRTLGFDWDNTFGTPTYNTWVARSDPEFLPVSLALSYTNPGIEIFAWKNRMKLSIGGSTSLNYDMIRPTLSEFAFSPKLIFSVNQFLHIGFSVRSRNRRIFWYFQSLDNHNVNNGNPPEGVEPNLFIDLFNSFAFWDQDLQRKSGFKLESLTLDVVHELHDWFLAASLTLAPQTAGTMFKTEFSISVLWRPMQSIKATVKTTKEGGDDAIFKLNPGETSKTTN